MMNEKDLQEKFDKLYSEKIIPYTKKLEIERLEKKKKAAPYVKVIKNGVPILVVLFFLMCSVNSDVIGLAFLCSFGGIILCCLITYKIYNRLDEKVKSRFLPLILNLFGEFNVSEAKFIGIDEVKKSGLFPSAKSQKNDDVFVGFYNGKKVIICETRLIHSSGNSSVGSDFHGLIIKTNIDKNFNNNLLVSSMPCMAVNRQKINLEDIEFNKIFQVYSDDQVEARYILTTGFMEKLKNIKDVFGTSGVSCFFDKSSVTLYVSTNADFFEFPVDKSYTDKATFENVVSQLNSIFNLINYLNFDNKTGL